jgi:hypothetical protein
LSAGAGRKNRSSTRPRRRRRDRARRTAPDGARSACRNRPAIPAPCCFYVTG